MAKSTLSFVCQNCGAAYNRWQGKCESCGEWNTLVEEDTTGATTMPVSVRSRRKGRLFTLESLTGKSNDAPRLPSGMAELDRVTGGGFVRGSVLLVGGDPGIARSISRARKPWRKCGCAPSVWGWRTRRCSLRPRPRSKTSCPRCLKARCRA
jgi:predicted ATP-dependent serine protease